jgi:hypothetical protein
MFEGPSTITSDASSVDATDGSDVPIDGLYLELLDGFVGVPPRELNDRVGELELRRRALDAETAAGIHVAEMSGSFSMDGHRSMTGFLKAKFNWSGGQVAQWLKISRFVAVNTTVGDAWAAGRIGSDQVLVLQGLHANLRVRHVFDGLLPLLLLRAEQLLCKDFEITIADIVAQVDQDGTHVDRDTAVAHRSAHFHVNGAELDVSVIGGDPVTAAEIVAIFDLAVQHEFDTDVAARAAEFGDDAANHPLPRTAGQRRHDAFIRVTRAGGAAITENSQAGTRSIAKVVVRVVIDEETFRQILADAGLAPAGMIRDAIGELVADPTGLSNRKCQMSDGTPIHPHDALRALLEGYVQRVVIDANSVVTDMGRESRLFTGYARQAALVLVTRCDHPGCDLPAEWCEVDHNIEWAAGGRTDQNNARPRCSPHNRFKSRNRWRSQRATNGYHYNIREDGTIVLPIGARPPTFAAEPGRSAESVTPYGGYGPEDPAEVERLNHIIRQRVKALRAA